MEYLMTYGWAILVVIIVGVVLWQMGIFNPSGGTAPGSSGFGSVRPKDWSCTSGGTTTSVQVQWVNGAGEQISLYPGAAYPTGISCSYANGTAITASTGKVSANAIFTCIYGTTSTVTGCSGIGAGNRFQSTVTLKWKATAGGITHVESGSVWKAAEA